MKSQIQTVTAEVEINFKDGKKTIQMEMKIPCEIENCEEGKAVVLKLKNGDTYTGIFRGMDDEDILLGSLKYNSTIGVNLSSIENYFEQI